MNKKICADCGLLHSYKECRCLTCHRKLKASTMRKSRKSKKIALIGITQSGGWKVCAKCLRRKRSSEYSTNRKDGKGRVNKLCDSCLVHTYNLRRPEGMCDKFWRARSYTVNTAHRAMLASQLAVKVSTISTSNLPYICKPQDLVQIFEKQSGLCAYCDIALTPELLTVDHALPRSRGGAYSPCNFRICCRGCNHLKHTMTEVEFSKFLPEYAKRIIQKWSNRTT